MDNPENADIREDANEGNETVSVETRINKMAEELTRDEKGKYILPDDLDEVTKFAVVAERRRRDTQSQYTKTTQDNKALQAEKAALLQRVTEDVKIELTPAQAEELEELKYSDPEAYRKKMNQYESTAVKNRTQLIDDELKQVSTSSLAKEEREQRLEILAAFNQAHPDFKLDDDVIKNDIPRRIYERFETGVIPFADFLQECYSFVKTGKVIYQEKLPNAQPNLSKVGGSSRPDAKTVEEDLSLAYKNTVM